MKQPLPIIPCSEAKNKVSIAVKFNTMISVDTLSVHNKFKPMGVTCSSSECSIVDTTIAMDAKNRVREWCSTFGNGKAKMANSDSQQQCNLGYLSLLLK